MKRLIYQVSLIDPLEGRPSKLYEWCIDSAKRYCEKYGITHVVQTEPILKIAPDWTPGSGCNRSEDCRKRGFLPIYEKENAFDYFKDYDQIAIIDADIYIKDNAPNIFEDLNGDFGGVIERDMPINDAYKRRINGYSRGQYSSLTDVDFKPNDKGYEFFNMGMMVMNKSITKYINGTAEEFIRRPEFKRFVDGVGQWRWSTDQTLLNYWVRKSGMNLHRMDWKWNTLYRAVKDEYVKDAYFVHLFNKVYLPERGENINAIKHLI